MGKEISRNNMKNEVLEQVMQLMREHFETDVLKVGASEAMMPAVDADGNEFYYTIKITAPRGTRKVAEKGYTPYDGYAAAKEYAEICADKEAEKQVNNERKAYEQAQKEAKRAAKKVVKDLNQKGLSKMIKEGE